MKIMFMSLSMMMSMLFTQMKHPLSFGMILLMQTVLITLISGNMTQNFWFSYILLLIFIGGMLILFIYVTSLASNEMIYMSTKMIISSMIILPLIFYFMKNNVYFMQNQETMNFMTTNNNMNYSLMKIYNQPTSIITIMLALYLFLTLIAVVKIINIFKGPLRKMN
uniref:NADH-ubiquinone oxidoreductase chain 6 n=1 Tax=Anallacta methanoides TaxID=1661865 RepID=A0A2P1H7T5_9NEOP|nr:NADH dehydrogenase subunit 6 [Anallacta methanoides]